MWCDKAAINRLWSIGTCCWIDWDHKCCLPTVWTTWAYPTHFCFFLSFTRAQTFQAAVVSQSVCICFLILNHLMALQEMKYELHLEKCPNYWFSSLVFYLHIWWECFNLKPGIDLYRPDGLRTERRSSRSGSWCLVWLFHRFLPAHPAHCAHRSALPTSPPFAHFTTPHPSTPHTFSSRCTHRIYIFWQE